MTKKIKVEAKPVEGLTPAKLAEMGGITGEQIVSLLSSPEGQEELEKTLMQMFDITVSQELKGMNVHNREEKRKALRVLKKKFTKRK